MPWIAGKRGSYRVMWREGGRGARVQASATYADKADAMEKLREVTETLAERRDTSGAALSSTPIPNLLKRWQESRLAGGRARKPYTIEAMAHVQGIADEMKWTRLSDITAESADRWRSKREGGRGTDKPLQCLKTFLRWCRRSLRLRVDMAVVEMEARRVPKHAPPPLLTDAQVAMILSRAMSFGLRYGTMLEHLLLYGCRPIDVARLRVKDWNFETRVITYRNTKNLDDFSHHVHGAHAARLDEVCGDRPGDDFIFKNKFGDPWRITETGQAEGLTSWYKANVGEWAHKTKGPDGKWIKEYVLPKEQRGIYCLKDYALSRLALASGGDRRAVVAISGHRSLSVTDRYMSTNAATQRRLIDAVAVPEIPSV